MMRERLLLSGFFLILAVLFLPTNAGASACVTLEKPVIVSKGGVLWNDASNILTEDSVALIMGTQGKSRGDDKHASPTGGWVVLDFGCFVDSVGSDVEIFEIGKAEGGEIYLGSKSASVRFTPKSDGTIAETGWTYVKPSSPPHFVSLQCPENTDVGCSIDKSFDFRACDGNETLPEASDKCPASDRWLKLDVGKNDGAQYRYVYLWSDGSKNADLAYGGSSDFDVVKVRSISSDIDLLAVVDSEEKQFVDFVPTGSTVKFVVNTSPDLIAIDGRYDCGESETSGNAGVLPAGQARRSFECQYTSEGVYVAKATISQLNDVTTVYVGQKAPSPNTSGRGSLTQPFGLKMFLWGVVVTLLGYCIVRMISGNLKD